MNKILSYVIGFVGVVGLMLVWYYVQALWKKTFPDHVVDDDAMAERTKCSNCSCTTACVNKTSK